MISVNLTPPKTSSPLSPALYQAVSLKHQNPSDRLEIRFGAKRAEVEAAFIQAATDGNQGALLGYLQAGQVNINAQDSNNLTALMWAAFNGKTDVVKALIQAKANLDIQDNNGRTALMGAAVNGHTDAVKALIQAKANLTLKGIYRQTHQTALMMAEANGHSEIVKLLEQALSAESNS